MTVGIIIRVIMNFTHSFSSHSQSCSPVFNCSIYNHFKENRCCKHAVSQIFQVTLSQMLNQIFQVTLTIVH